MNLNTSIWGPSLWRVLHSFAFSLNYEKDQSVYSKKKQELLHFIESLQLLLPCEECRLHFQEYIQLHNPKKAQNLAYWTFDLHNSVNQRIGKPQFSYEDVSKMYEDSHCSIQCKSNSLLDSVTKKVTNTKRKDVMDYGMLILLIIILCFSTSLLFIFKNKIKY
jgi:hypothetical protein